MPSRISIVTQLKIAPFRFNQGSQWLEHTALMQSFLTDSQHYSLEKLQSPQPRSYNKNDLQFYISDLYVISVEVHFEPKLIFCFSPQSIKTEDWKIVGRRERRQFCTMTTILLHSLVCTASIPKICTRYLVYRMEDEQKIMAWRWVSTFTIVQL